MPRLATPERAPAAAGPAPEPAAAPAAPVAFSRAGRFEELALAIVLVICASTFARWQPFVHLWTNDVLGLKAIPWHWVYWILFLTMGLLLTLPTWRRSGLGLGTLSEHRLPVLAIVLVTVAAVAIVYPFLPVRPWYATSITMWTISPLAQQLIFMGYLYGRLERVFPGRTAGPVPVAHALIVTCALFAFWHVPNFLALPVGYVAFQLLYTGLFALVPGLTRQWTGSIWPAVFTHCAVNFIAWVTP